MPLTATQRAFVTSKEPYPCFVGGFGSGKTAAAMARAMALKVMCRTASIAYYLPTYPLIQDIAFERFPELCERKGWAFKLNRQDAVMEFPGAGRIVFRNMEQPDRIVGYEVAHSLVDEIDIMTTVKARAGPVASRFISCGQQPDMFIARRTMGTVIALEIGRFGIDHDFAPLGRTCHIDLAKS